MDIIAYETFLALDMERVFMMGLVQSLQGSFGKFNLMWKVLNFKM